MSAIPTIFRAFMSDFLDSMLLQSFNTERGHIDYSVMSFEQPACDITFVKSGIVTHSLGSQ